jgi:hypothetical protein
VSQLDPALREVFSTAIQVFYRAIQGYAIGGPPEGFRRIWGPEFKISGFSLAVGSVNDIGQDPSGGRVAGQRSNGDGDAQIQGSFVAQFALAFPLGNLSTLKLKICDNDGVACLAFCAHEGLRDEDLNRMTALPRAGASWMNRQSDNGEDLCSITRRGC